MPRESLSVQCAGRCGPRYAAGVRAHAAVPERCRFLLRPDVSGWDSADSLAVGRPLPRIADQGEGLRGEADLDALPPRQPEAVALHPVAERDEPVAEDLEAEGPRVRRPSVREGPGLGGRPGSRAD